MNPSDTLLGVPHLEAMERIKVSKNKFKATKEDIRLLQEVEKRYPHYIEIILDKSNKYVRAELTTSGLEFIAIARKLLKNKTTPK